MTYWQERPLEQQRRDSELITGNTGQDEAMTSTDIDGEEFPIELTDEQRQAFAEWLSERVEGILAHAPGLSEEDRALLREYLTTTELEDIVSEWLDAYSDPDNLADLAAQLRSEEGEEP